VVTLPYFLLSATTGTAFLSLPNFRIRYAKPFSNRGLKPFQRSVRYPLTQRGCPNFAGLHINCPETDMNTCR